MGALRRRRELPMVMMDDIHIHIHVHFHIYIYILTHIYNNIHILIHSYWYLYCTDPLFNVADRLIRIAAKCRNHASVFRDPRWVINGLSEVINRPIFFASSMFLEYWHALTSSLFFEIDWEISVRFFGFWIDLSDGPTEISVIFFKKMTEISAKMKKIQWKFLLLHSINLVKIRRKHRYGHRRSSQITELGLFLSLESSLCAPFTHGTTFCQ